ncbi:hypothetical protein D9M68_727800 [compost metagenome]
MPPPLAAVVTDGAIMGDFVRQRQGYAHAVFLGRFQELDADVVHNFSSGVTVTKTAAHGIDQLVVVTSQYRDQGCLGRCVRHGGRDSLLDSGLQI